MLTISSVEDNLFGDMFAIPAPAVESPTAVVSPTVTVTPVVAKKSSPLSKHELAVRKLKLMNKGMAMGALIEIYQEMEAAGRVTSPAPAQEPVSAPVAATAVVSVSAPVVPDLGSEEEVSSGSEKDSTTTSPSSQSSLSDEENFLSKIHVTPIPTPTKAKKYTSLRTPVTVAPMKALTSETLTIPSPLRMNVPVKSRPDSPAPPSRMKLTGHGRKAFTPSLAVIESSPLVSPSEEQSPPASPFVRPGNPTPTKATRGTRNFAPLLSPIRDTDVLDEEEEDVSSPAPIFLGGVMPTKTTFVGDDAQSDALEELAEPLLQLNGVEVVEDFTPIAKEKEKDIPEVPLTNTGIMITIAGSYLVAQSMRIAPMTVAILVGGAVLASTGFLMGSE